MTEEKGDVCWNCRGRGTPFEGSTDGYVDTECIMCDGTGKTPSKHTNEETMTIKRYNTCCINITYDDAGKWCQWSDHSRIVSKIASHRDKLLEEVKALRLEIDNLRGREPCPLCGAISETLVVSGVKIFGCPKCGTNDPRWVQGYSK